MRLVVVSASHDDTQNQGADQWRTKRKYESHELPASLFRWVSGGILVLNELLSAWDHNIEKVLVDCLENWRKYACKGTRNDELDNYTVAFPDSILIHPSFKWSVNQGADESDTWADGDGCSRIKVDWTWWTEGNGTCQRHKDHIMNVDLIECERVDDKDPDNASSNCEPHVDLNNCSDWWTKTVIKL